jgi:hypothetical protein
MDGSSISLILIPAVVVISLAAWLIAVAYAASHPSWKHGPASPQDAHSAPPPGAQIPLPRNENPRPMPQPTGTRSLAAAGHPEEIDMAGEGAQAATTAVSGADPRSAAVTFVTTEHFTLQGARAATIAESTGRATMFLGSVSAGLVALGLIATATRIGATFYAFAVVVLATLSFVGLVTFERVLQSGIEDHGYAQRIARLRGFYIDCAPEVTVYLVRVPPPQRLAIQGLDTGHWRGSRTIAGMVGVVTAVLAGSTAGLIAAVATDHSAVAGFATGGVVALAAVAALMRVQNSAWERIRQHPYFDCQPAAVPQLAASNTAGDGHQPGQGPRRGRSQGQQFPGVEGRLASHDRKSTDKQVRSPGRRPAGRDGRRPGRRVDTAGAAGHL